MYVCLKMKVTACGLHHSHMQWPHKNPHGNGVLIKLINSIGILNVSWQTQHSTVTLFPSIICNVIVTECTSNLPKTSLAYRIDANNLEI